jgi:hypothetical protein
MDQSRQRPHRPARYPDLTGFIDAAGGQPPSSHAETASATAWAVLTAARGSADEAQRARFVALADRVGLDTLATLWSDCEPASLPGTLWALYLLRQWCRSNGDEVARLWRAGEPVADADAVIAGVRQLADASAVEDVADAVLGGACGGDFAVALERAAAIFRVLAAGRRERCGDDESAIAVAERRRAERNERTARDLVTAARRWRSGTLR